MRLLKLGMIMNHDPNRNRIKDLNKGIVGANNKAGIQHNPFESSTIKRFPLMRTNQHDYRKQSYVFRTSRKRMETLFLPMCEQSYLRKTFYKSFIWFKPRILAMTTALTVVRYINKFVFSRNINTIKNQHYLEYTMGRSN